MSEQSVQLKSQASFRQLNASLDSAGQAIQPRGLTQAALHARNKPRFAEYCCSHVEVRWVRKLQITLTRNTLQVFRYVNLVTKAVIPVTFWGSELNYKLICDRECVPTR
jgi:hypothetical protein